MTVKCTEYDSFITPKYKQDFLSLIRPGFFLLYRATSDIPFRCTKSVTIMFYGKACLLAR
ncbi:hypothetical protein PPNK14_28320 [Pectobacterium parmentieri]